MDRVEHAVQVDPMAPRCQVEHVGEVAEAVGEAQQVASLRRGSQFLIFFVDEPHPELAPVLRERHRW